MTENTNIANPSQSSENPNGIEQVSEGVFEETLLESNWDEVVETFEDLGLKKLLLRGIFGFGFTLPSFIQQKAIKPIILKKDIIAQAQSGSGKTATFLISMLQNIDHEDLKLQALVLAPTRELAKQIYDISAKIGYYLGTKSHLCTGGNPVIEDKKKIQEGLHYLVGTPGRIKDMIERKILSTSYLKMLIIDEADEMLGRGFLEQINEIIKVIPPDCQICLFSATMPSEIVKMTTKIMNNPVRILVKKEQITLEGIKQYQLGTTNDSSKYDALVEIYANINVNQPIIFANSKEKAEAIATKMSEKDFVVSCIHGAMEQKDRNQIMEDFKSGASRILIGTDLVARGIDVQQVDLVINFELPTNKENYIHRIGRAGRYGRKGVAINLVSSQEVAYMLEICDFYKTTAKPLPNDLGELD